MSTSKRNWSKEEDQDLKKLVSSIGTSWKEIAKSMKGRTKDACMQRYRNLLAGKSQKKKKEERSSSSEESSSSIEEIKPRKKKRKKKEESSSSSEESSTFEEIKPRKKKNNHAEDTVRPEIYGKNEPEISRSPFSSSQTPEQTRQVTNAPFSSLPTQEQNVPSKLPPFSRSQTPEQTRQVTNAPLSSLPTQERNLPFPSPQTSRSSTSEQSSLSELPLVPTLSPVDGKQIVESWTGPAPMVGWSNDYTFRIFYRREARCNYAVHCTTTKFFMSVTPPPIQVHSASEVGVRRTDIIASTDVWTVTLALKCVPQTLVGVLTPAFAGASIEVERGCNLTTLQD